jgi:outer membrane lipoprotein-sorting protein
MSAQTIRLIAMLSFVGLLSPQGAYAQGPSASDLLEKIAQTYRQVSSFSVVAEKKVDLDTDTRGEMSLNPNPNVVHAGSHESYDIQVALMASGSSKAKLLLKEDNKNEIVVVNDGKLVWTLIPGQHAYTEVDAKSSNVPTSAYEYLLRTGDNDISGVNLLQQYETLVATRFQSISGYRAWAKLERSETLKVGNDKKECYVLTIQRPGSAEKHKFWVDKKELAIWRSVETTLRPWDEWVTPGVTLQTTITLTIKQMTLNPSLDDSNFVFTFPDQAKKVDILKLSGENPF